MENKKRTRVTIPRTVALCYIRQSFTRSGEPDDLNSPERQRANIQAACDRNGWTPEWYEDVGGHRSGRSEKNRPQWLALKARLGDPDIIALVANDLSRLHRKVWKVGDLIDFLNERQINLLLTAPGREVDTTTVKGRMFVQVGAMIDEFYAEDISARAKDSIEYRKAQGKSVGLPPFGTIRDQEGYLTPSTEGAWLLNTGEHVAGMFDARPADNAIWRGYYDAANRILNLYAAGDVGLEKIAYAVNEEGWAFRDRAGVPRSFDRDDIRRVVSGWPGYGGILAGSRGKDRHAYEKIDVDEIPFRPDRAIFSISLLRSVARARQERSVRPIDQSVKRKAHAYALSGLTHCAHCDRLAQDHNDPRRRSLLSGNLSAKGVFLYRHKLGVRCAATNRSVPCDLVEQDFNRLLKMLMIHPDAVDTIASQAVELGLIDGSSDDPVTFQQQKQEAITLCRRRIDAAVVLYGDGMIDKEEYRRRVERNEREIIHWENRTTEIERVGIQLAICVRALKEIVELWDSSKDEDKQGLARTLFTELVYDLDTQRIVSFKLKPWADQFLTVRAAFYEKEDNEKTPASSGNNAGNDVTEKPLGGISLPIASLPSIVDQLGKPRQIVNDYHNDLEPIGETNRHRSVNVIS